MNKRYTFTDKLSNEANFLLSCVKANWTNLSLSHLQVGNLDWNYLIQLADKNYVIPLLYKSIREHHLNNIPKEVIDTLRVRSKLIAWRNNLFSSELVKLNKFLVANDVSAIHYKGPVVAEIMYGDLSLRTFNDLDFLVKRKDLPKVIDILINEGYSFNTSLQAEQRIQLERELKEYKFSSGPINLEPHWSLTARRFPLEINYDELWHRAQPILVNDETILTFSQEDLFLTLCVVGGKGRWKRLQMICDIANAMHKFDQLDWQHILEYSTKLGTRRLLLLAVLLAAELLGVASSDMLLKKARSDRTVIALAKKITISLFRENHQSFLLGDSPNIFSPLLYMMRERPRDKILYLFRTTTTPLAKHIRRFPLPNKLFPLYRIIVPVHDYVLQPAYTLGQTLFRVDNILRLSRFR